jgi:hypothetical protein
LLTLPAGSTRRKKNGTPRAPWRCRLHSRWAACSKLTPKRAAERLDVVAQGAGGFEIGLVRHQQAAAA